MVQVSRVERFPKAARRAFASLALAMLGVVGGAASAATYRIVVLPLPPGDIEYPAVTGINNAGDAVGHVDIVTSTGRSSRALVWRAAAGHAAHELPMGDASSAVAKDINDAGDIVGQFSNPPRAVLWRGESFTLLRTPSGSHSDARQITAGGTIRGNTAHPFEGTWETLWVDPMSPRELRFNYLRGPFDDIFVRAMNDAGVLVGGASAYADGMIHAVRQRPGGRIELLAELDRPGVEWAYYTAWDVNNVGQAAGDVIWPYPGRALLWNRDGSVRDLGSLPSFPDGSYSARRINDAGVVTGTFSSGGQYQSFVWTAATGMRSIADLIDRRDPVHPLIAAGAPILIEAINDSGAMAAMLGYNDGPQVPILLLPEGMQPARAPRR